jgi:TolB-like protein
MAQNRQPGKKAIFATAVNDQLQRIYSHQVFAVSDILKRFLSFIVNETLEGRSNQLKEYTIGVGVLNKPIDFKPQKDAIVRIHAGRLRRALDYYYSHSTEPEIIHISIPKGSYVPVLIESSIVTGMETTPGYVNKQIISGGLLPNSMTVAVMPFTCYEKTLSKISFAEGLAGQLTTTLSHIKNISVIAFFSIQKLANKIVDVKEIFTEMGAHYIFTGQVQFVKSRFRVNIQMIDTQTGEQVWNYQFEQHLTNRNMFELQDGITEHVASMFENYYGQNQRSILNPTLAAIA